MPNPDNIKPYSDLVHKAAEEGGPEKYIKNVADTNYSLGLQDGKEQQSFWVTIFTGVGVGLGVAGYALVQKIVKKHKDKKRAKREALEIGAQRAKEEYLDYVTKETQEEEE